MRTAISYTRFSSAKQSLGHSEERQVESARAYAKEHGFVLQEIVDRGISAYSGKNVSEGALATLIKKVRAGELPKDLVLLVEDPDRISRQPFDEAYTNAYQPLLKAGIEIHFLSFRGVLKPRHSFSDLIQIGIKHDLGHAESAKKSERCGKAWTKKRHNANGQAAMSARVPAWLTAVKGQPIRVIPERARIVRQIFDWSAKGFGQYAICDKLIARQVPPWGPVYKGRPPRWTPFYVSAILSSRAVIGEYTPHAKTGGKRIPDGPPVADYYPAVVPLSLWQKVQDARMAFAQSKFGEALHGGRNKFSNKNLFRKLVWDLKNGVPMVYRQYEGWACLVSTHRKQLRQHRIPYRLFEGAVLEYLSTADWKSLAHPEEDPKTQELIERRESLAREIDDAAKVLARYEAILDDPSSSGFERITDKYKAAAARSQRLLQARSALEAEFDALGNGQAAIAATEGPEFIDIDSTSPERRTKLRLLIAQRIERIDLVWSPTLIGAEQIGLPENPYAWATVRFRNGAWQMIVFPSRERAHVLNPPLNSRNSRQSDVEIR